MTFAAVEATSQGKFPFAGAGLTVKSVKNADLLAGSCCTKTKNRFRRVLAQAASGIWFKLDRVK
jgi:hypothetical protein